MQMIGTLARAAGVIGVTTLLVACGGGGDGLTVATAPRPSRSGSATVSMSGAPATMAALRLRVAGAGLSAPVPGTGVRIVLQTTVGDTTVFVLAVSSPAPASLLTFALADIDQPVAARVDEATSGRNAGYAALRAADVAVAVARQ